MKKTPAALIDAVRLAVSSGMNLKEAAESTGVPYGTVRGMKERGLFGQETRLTRDDALAELGKLVKESPIQYKAALLRLVADMERWAKPSADDAGRTLSLKDLIAEWRLEQQARDAQHDTGRSVVTSEGGSPPHENEIEAIDPLSQPDQNSKKSEEDESA